MGTQKFVEHEAKPEGLSKIQASYASGSYWERRSDMLYYRYVDYIVRTIGAEAKSLIDVGTGNAPYIEWFDWIERRVSVDLEVPYRSDRIRGIKGDIFSLNLERHDVCTCLQVLEHVPDAGAFGKRLLQLGRTVLVTVPFNWPEGQTKDHVHDPVDYAKLTGWMGVEANYKQVVKEPFHGRKRLIAVYDEDPKRRFGTAVRRKRIRR